MDSGLKSLNLNFRCPPQRAQRVFIILFLKKVSVPPAEGAEGAEGGFIFNFVSKKV